MNDNFIKWEITFNLPDGQKSALKINPNGMNEVTDIDIICEEDYTMQYLNKWKELTEEKENARTRKNR